MDAGVTKFSDLERILATGDFYDHWSPLSSPPCVAIDLTAPRTIPDEIRERLQTIPCPVIGVGRSCGEVAEACDLLTDDIDGLRQLVVRIEQAPTAAMTLVQLLRATDGMSVGNALAMESLAYATLQSGAEFAHWLYTTRKKAEPSVAEDGPAVLLDRRNDVLNIVLNRPGVRNEIGTAIRDGLVEGMRLAVVDRSISQVRISGAGKCFSIGGALGEFGLVDNPAAGHAIRSVQLPARWLSLCADRATASVHSACIGAGIEIPAFATRIIAHKNAFFQLPELTMGLIPGAGGCVSIPRRIGRQRTAWLAISGKRIDALTALNWGLVDELTDEMAHPA